MAAVFGAVFATGVVAASGFDLASRRIPNWLNASLLLTGLGARAATGSAAEVGWGAVGALVGLAIFFVPFALRWFGAGDAKLICAMGAWLGPAGIAWAALYGVAAGGVLALIVALVGGRELRREVATNMRVFAATGAAPAVGPRARSRQVPLAVALGAAGIGVFFVSGGFHG